MKHRITIILLLISGLALLLYPDISRYYTAGQQQAVISNYQQELQRLSAQQLQEEWQRCQAYNNSLPTGRINDPFAATEQEDPADSYLSLLSMGQAMAVLEIPQIRLKLPIYHGTAAPTLKKGIGHLEQTSLPIGGAGCHAVLTAHSGLAAAPLFDDLHLLEKGDLFFIQVLDQVLAYQVDQILVVEPADTSAIQPQPNQDYLTLLTCTPYGINSYRLLVRGTRLETCLKLITSLLSTAAPYQAEPTNWPSSC